MQPIDASYTPKEKYTFLVYGDSISRGVIFDDAKQKFSLLAESFTNIVKEQLKGVVYNAGRFGSTIVEGLQRLQNDVLKRNPDIVLIEFGGNDCDFRWQRIAQDPSGVYHPNTECSVFSQSLSRLITTLTTREIVPVLVTLPPLDPDRYFKRICEGSEQAAENILRWIGSVSHIYSWHERYNAAILRVAEETKTRVIDIRSSFLQRDDYTTLICEDGIHPNKEGHRVIAEKILTYVQTNYTFLLNGNSHQAIIA